jgi:pimeloyl-ACP methyl ester carboxylesterase
MNNPRTYGTPPYTVAVLHGGPGAPGEMVPVCREMSHNYGVLEPFQTELTIKGQLRELGDLLHGHATLPVTIIGYSWGAVLGFLFTVKNPGLVKKLIMVSSAPLREDYAATCMKTRCGRLTDEENVTLNSLIKDVEQPRETDVNRIFARIGGILLKADSYDPLPHESYVHGFRYDIYRHISDEFVALRNSGTLDRAGREITCPVIAIHGDYDPHPADGVQIPLSRTVRNFRFIIIGKCGHTPWIEKRAKERFFKTLMSVLRE